MGQVFYVQLLHDCLTGLGVALSIGSTEINADLNAESRQSTRLLMFRFGH